MTQALAPLYLKCFITCTVIYSGICAVCGRCLGVRLFVFQANLGTLMVKMGTDHPFHALYPLFSLSNGDRGRNGKVVPTTAKPFKQRVDTDKIQAARDVLTEIQKKR